MTSPPPPACFWSSTMIWDLSEAESVGAWRIVPSLGSLAKTDAREAIALAVGSRVEVFVAAAYYKDG